MICTICGNKLSKHARSCDNCGKTGQPLPSQTEGIQPQEQAEPPQPEAEEPTQSDPFSQWRESRMKLLKIRAVLFIIGLLIALVALVANVIGTQVRPMQHQAPINHAAIVGWDARD